MFSSTYVQIGLIFLLLIGCSSPPRWVEGTGRSPYYFQGVGMGPSPAQAERSAYFDLCANINGTEVKQVIEDYQREYSTAGKVTLDSDFRQWLTSYVEGKVPAEASIVSRWENDKKQWAYAIVEKPGKLRSIKARYNRHMANVRAHSFVPGWAQLQKRQNKKAWTLITGMGIGIVGGATFAVLSNDALTKRDQSTLRIERDHFDNQANQRFWISTAFYVLAGGTYLANVLDGFYSVVDPYQILTQVNSEMIHITFRF